MLYCYGVGDVYEWRTADVHYIRRPWNGAYAIIARPSNGTRPVGYLEDTSDARQLVHNAAYLLSAADGSWPKQIGGFTLSSLLRGHCVHFGCVL
jgi:hypothetical protein